MSMDGSVLSTVYRSMYDNYVKALSTDEMQIGAVFTKVFLPPHVIKS